MRRSGWYRFLGVILTISLTLLQTPSFGVVIEEDPSVAKGHPRESEDQIPALEEMSQPAVHLDPAGGGSALGGEGESEEPEYVPGRVIVKLKEGYTLADLESQNQRFGVTNARDLFPKRAPPQERLEALKQERAGLGGKEHKRWYWWSDKGSEEAEDYETRLAREKERLDQQILNQEQLITRLERRQQRAPRDQQAPSLENTFLLETTFTTFPMDVRAMVAAYQADPSVEHAQPDYLYKYELIPNDPYYTSSGSWGQPYDDLWGLQRDRINAEEAWDLTQGEGVLVAVIDSGVDIHHEDLAANIWVNQGEIVGNAIDDDGNGYVDDVHGYNFFEQNNDPTDELGHGTHVAGTIAAVGNNNIGIIGVAPLANVMALKIGGRFLSFSTSAAVEAIRYAADNGADILNGSWGGYGSDATLEETVLYAYSSGCVLVFAAGNNRRNARFHLPSNMSETIAVSATAFDDTQASFTNFGNSMDLAAPGVEILSLRAEGTDLYRDGSHIVGERYYRANGTSMACPHAAGVAALVLSLHPDFSNEQVRSALKMSARAITSEAYLGQGRLDAREALEVASPPEVILRSFEEEVARGAVDILGTAAGETMLDYRLSYGSGENPTSWTDFHISRTPVSDGVLYANFETWQLADGLYTLRLVVTTTDGRHLVSRTRLKIRNMGITYPLGNDIFRKEGQTIEILGFVASPFQSYVVEVGEGPDPQTWHTAGMRLVHSGGGENLEGPLALWDTSVLPEPEGELGSFYTVRLTAQTVAGERTSYARMVYFDEKLMAGWPLHVSPQPYDVQVVDLDGDGRREIITHHYVTRGTVQIVVFNADGTLRWSRKFEQWGDFQSFTRPAFGDLDQDGRMEIVVTHSGFSFPESVRSLEDIQFFTHIVVLRADGSDFGPPWPLELSPTMYPHITLADLDLDGEIEILAFTLGSTADFFSEGSLLILNPRGQIEREIVVPVNGGYYVSLPVSVGNFDADPELEIVTRWETRETNTIAVLDTDGTLMPGWPQPYSGELFHQPSVGDVDGDGMDNVIFGTRFSLRGHGEGRIYVFAQDGSLLPGWPALDPASSSLALADLDRDGDLEIVSAWGRYIDIYDHKGNLLVSPPMEMPVLSREDSSTIVGDVNGDGVLDIVCSGGGFTLAPIWYDGDFSYEGGVFAWRGDDGSPLDLNEDSANLNLFKEASSRAALAGSYEGFAGPAYLTDLNGDGLLDLLSYSIGDTQWNSELEYERGEPLGVQKNRGSIYVWELGVPYDPQMLPWPMSGHDPQHTGRYVPTGLGPNRPQPSPGNHALGIMPTVSSTFNPSYVPQQATDGLYGTDKGGWVGSSRNGINEWLLVDLGVVRNVGWIRYDTRYLPAYLDTIWQEAFTISGSVDGVNWFVLAQASGIGQGEARLYEFSFAPSEVRYIKVHDITSHTTLTPSWHYAYVGELEVYDVAPDPLPELTPPFLDPIGNREVNEGELLTFTVTASDPDGDPLTYTASNLPEGAVFDPGTQAFTWSPTFDQAGTYPGVHFEVTDGDLSHFEDVLIIVTNINRPPILDPIGDREVNEGEALTFTVKAIDLDEDPLTYTASDLPEGAVFDPDTQVFTWTPAFDQAGLYEVHFEVTDGDLSHFEDLLLIVENVNQPPVIRRIGHWPRTVKPSRPVLFYTSAYDPDDRWFSLTYHWDFGDGIRGEGRYLYHTYSEVGTYTLVLKVTDPKGASTVKRLSVEVVDVNQPPVIRHIGHWPRTVKPNRPVILYTFAYDPDDRWSALTYRWDFGDGRRGTGRWVFHRYRRRGIYSGTLTVTDREGASTSRRFTIRVR